MNAPRLATLLLFVPSILVAQKSGFPKLHKPGRYSDDTTYVTLQLAKDKSVPLHLDVNDVHCVIREGVTHRQDGGVEVAIGSAREKELLGALQACLDRSFDAERQAAIRAAKRFGHDRKKMTWDEYLRGQLLRSMHRYRTRTGAKIESIVVGKGTVRLSLKITLPGAKAELFTFRQMKDADSLRLHRGDQTQSVPLGSEVETQVILGARTFVAQAKQRDQKLRALATVLGDYARATAPRSLQVFFLRDGGTVQVHVVDASAKACEFRFDHKLGTKTPGRLEVSWGRLSGLIAIGSKEEKKVLAFLERAIVLGRESARGARAAETLAKRLEGYRATFHDD